MFLHGVWRSGQDDGDFRVGLAFGDPVKHLRFARSDPQSQQGFWAVVGKPMFDPHQREAARPRKQEIVDFNLSFLGMTNDQRVAGVAAD